MADQIEDDGSMADVVTVPEQEINRQLEDLNDELFDRLLGSLQILLDMFRDPKATALLEVARGSKDTAEVVRYLENLMSKGYNQTWDIIRFVQNLRNPDE